MKISIDSERKIDTTDNYDEFNALINKYNLDTKKNKKKEKITPITSYGIILVYEDDEYLYYFIGQLRTTIEFTELIRAGPPSQYFYEYLSLMTNQERDILLNYSHGKIWNDLLIDHPGLDKVRYYIGEKFNDYRDILPKLIELTYSSVNDLPFGFPKGRCDQSDQTYLATALRELKEEANIDLKTDKNGITLMDSDIIYETFIGTNKETYRTIYYVVKAHEKYEPTMRYLSTNIISEYALSEDFVNYYWLPLNKKINISETVKTPLCKRQEKMLLKLHRKLITKNIT